MPVCGHTLIAKALEYYDHANPYARARTFDTITNLQSATKVAAKFNANVMKSEVYLSFEAEKKRPKTYHPPPRLHENSRIAALHHYYLAPPSKTSRSHCTILITNLLHMLPASISSRPKLPVDTEIWT